MANMTEAEKERRQGIVVALNRNGLSRPDAHYWAHIEKLRNQEWSVIVPELAQELADVGGKITDYYVNRLLDIAKKAIPAIDDVELANKSLSATEDS